MRKRWLLYIVGSVLLATGCVMTWPFLSLVAPKQLRDYVYREMTYILIANRIVSKEKGPAQEIAKRINTYVHTSVFPGTEYRGEQSFFLDNLVSGQGVCFDHSQGLLVLAYHAGIDGQTRGMASSSFGHVVAELWIDGKWRYFDPFYGLAFTYISNGQVTTVHDIKGGEVSSSKAIALNMYNPEFMQRYFTLNPLGTWGPFSRSQDWLRMVIGYLVHISVRLPGPTLAWYQDLYFSHFWTPDPRSGDFFGSHILQDPGFLDFYQARNFHLWGRKTKARELYQRLIEEKDKEDWADDALYFLGHSYREEGAFDLAVHMFERLLSHNPETFWKNAATYWLAWSYEQQGKVDLARNLYQTVATHEGLDASVRLMDLRTSEEIIGNQTDRTS